MSNYRLILAVVTLLLSLGHIQSSFAQETIEGVYSTNFNELTLTRQGSRITGTYKHRNGHIQGTLTGLTVTGRWTQDNGEGRMEFTFASDFSGFKGLWSYGDAMPTKTWNGDKIRSISNTSTSAPQTLFAADQFERNYGTNFGDMTLVFNGSKVTGHYTHKNGKIEGVLSGNKLVGTWTQTNAKGKLEFDFNNNFSNFDGRWGYNNSTPNQEWTVNRPSPAPDTANIPPTPAPKAPDSKESYAPVYIAGSWGANGSLKHRGRINFWQNGNNVTVVIAWPDQSTGQWKSSKGEGTIQGREFSIRMYPSTPDGSSSDQGYVHYFTVAPGNKEISTYYTRHGKQMRDPVVYRLVE